MNRRADAVAALEARLGHRFTDPDLLERALTHVSVAGGAKADAHNETFEFLGDRVLGLLAAEALVKRNPEWREGELTRRHAALVSGTRCAEVARGLHLGPALRLHGGATKQGGRENVRILGDAMEALMAAVYLDAGLEAARSLFASAWRVALEEVAQTDAKDAKTALQEWAAARNLPPPAYRLVSRTGSAHTPLFTVEVSIAGGPGAPATGATLRAAQKAAAAAWRAREGVDG